MIGLRRSRKEPTAAPAREVVIAGDHQLGTLANVAGRYEAFGIDGVSIGTFTRRADAVREMLARWIKQKEAR